MLGVILDQSSFFRDDIDLSGLYDYGVIWTNYPSTTPNQITNRIDQCEVVITNKVVLGAKELAIALSLKLILIAATGTDNVDLDICKKRGILVCNVRHYATPAVAQHTIGLMLNLLTNQIRYQHDVQSGKWSSSDVFCLLDHPIIEAQGKTMGIIGHGNLGSRVAEIAKAFGMSINVCQRPGGKSKAGRVSFDEILTQSDVLTLHCPLNSETRNLLGKKEFQRMKNSAIVINTARGAIINSQDLIEALESGEIAGAGIDVLDKEPPPQDHPLLQCNLPNLLISPHNAWATRETRQRLVNELADNLSGWINNSPKNIVG